MLGVVRDGGHRADVSAERRQLLMHLNDLHIVQMRGEKIDKRLAPDVPLETNREIMQFAKYEQAVIAAEMLGDKGNKVLLRLRYIVDIKLGFVAAHRDLRIAAAALGTRLIGAA